MKKREDDCRYRIWDVTVLGTGVQVSPRPPISNKYCRDRQDMKNEKEAMERLIVESAADGLVELFGEGYSEKFDSYKSVESVIEKTEKDITELVRSYWKLQVKAFGGSLEIDSDNTKKAIKSANLATSNFISQLSSVYQSDFNDSIR